MTTDTDTDTETLPTVRDREREMDDALETLAALLAEGEAIRARIAALVADVLPGEREALRWA